MNESVKNVEMVKFGFDTKFIPIFQTHFYANISAICRRNAVDFHKAGNIFEIEKRHVNYDKVARQYREGFDAYSTKKSFKWARFENEPDIIQTPKMPESEILKKVEVHDFAYLLSESTQRFTLPTEIQESEHILFVQGDGHGCSHPRLVHKFLSTLIDDHDMWTEAINSANWTCIDLYTHESALKGGEIVGLNCTSTGIHAGITLTILS